MCNGCKAIVSILLRRLKDSKSEMDIDDAMENLCNMKDLNSFDYPPPQMKVICLTFITKYNDLIEVTMLEREDNESTINTLCYEKTESCIESYVDDIDKEL